MGTARVKNEQNEDGLLFERLLGKAWVAPVFFLLFAIIYFAGFVFSDDVMEGLDTRMEFHLGKEPASEKIADLSPENWKRYLGGTPISGFRQPKYFPLYPIYAFTTFHRYLGWRYFFATFFTGYFTYLCVRGLPLKRTTAALAGLAYASSPTLLTFVYPGQEGKMLVIGLLPLMVWALYRIIDTRKPIFTFVLGAGVAAGIYTPHLQMLYYALIGLGILFGVRLIQTYVGERDIRMAALRSSLAAAGIILGLAVGAAGTFPAYKYTKTESRRAGDQGQGVTKEYAQSWSLHPEEIASLLIPEFVHFFKPQDRQNLYWGRNALKLNAEYFGIAVVFFAALALGRIRRDRRVLPLAVLIAITLAFSLGPHTPVFNFFFHFVPGTNLLRTPGMIAFLFAFPAVLLAAMSIDRLLCRDIDLDPKQLLPFGGTVGAVFLITALAPESVITGWTRVFWSDAASEKIQIATANLPSLTTGAWLALLWWVSLAVLTYLRIQKRIPAQTLILALLPVILIDTWRIDKQFLKYVDPERSPDPDVLIPQTLGTIESDAGYHRTWVPAGDVQFPESVDLLTVNYHEPFILRRYDRATVRLMESLQKGLREPTYKLMNVLNVKYLAIGAQRVQAVLPPLVGPGSTEGKVSLRRGVEAVANERGTYLFRNQNAQPFFYLSGDPVTIMDGDQVLNQLSADTFNPITQVILESDPGLVVTPEVSSDETVVVESFNARQGEIVLTVNAAHPRVLVVCQNFHPYWSAEIDGEPVQIHRANYVWQAVVVPAGEYTISLIYHDALAQMCRWVSLISALILVGGLVYFSRPRPNDQKQVA